MDTLSEIANRHTVHLNKMYSGVANQYEPYLQDIATVIRAQLVRNDLNVLNRAKLERFLKTLNKDLLIIQGKYTNDILIPSTLDLAVSEAKFEVKSLEQVVKHDFNVPTEAQLRATININPLNITGSYKGQLLEPFIKEISTKSIETVSNWVRVGYYSGQTTNQIVRNIVGTKKLNYTDGQLYTVNRNIESMVRTSLSHVSAQARKEVATNNSDIIQGFKILVTFDSRTSPICQAHGSTPAKIYDFDKDPLPPYHINCRSSYELALTEEFSFLDKGAKKSARDSNGKVIEINANKSYYSWLKDQPPAYQDSVIGSTRGKLLRSGGLTVKRFSELQLNKFNKPRKTIFRNGKPLTQLEQMQEDQPLAFKKSGIPTKIKEKTTTIDFGYDGQFNSCKYFTAIQLSFAHRSIICRKIN